MNYRIGPLAYSNRKIKKNNNLSKITFELNSNKTSLLLEGSSATEDLSLNSC